MRIEPGDRLAIEIWSQAVSFSGFDAQGLPTLLNIGFVMKNYYNFLTSLERIVLLEKVRFISDKVRAYMHARIQQARAGSHGGR